jgi:hypothetical protein
MPQAPSLEPAIDGPVFAPKPVSPPARPLLAQFGAATLTAAYAAAMGWVTGEAWSMGQGTVPLLLLHAVLAASLGQALGLAAWWLPVNALFVPAAVWMRELDIAPAWFFAAFVGLAALFWSTHRTRVPLYLTSRRSCERLASLLPATGEARVLDLGCGFGGVLLALHRLRPGLRLTGREVAPLPAWIARWRLRNVAVADVRRADFWEEDLSQYDMVYAFLSPEAMPRLWHKACTEMRSGSMLVSNAFPIREADPDLALPWAGAHRSPLYVWRF